eukprot:1394392-Amorphochlora_amoeboformis.AAC.1
MRIVSGQPAKSEVMCPHNFLAVKLAPYSRNQNSEAVPLTSQEQAAGVRGGVPGVGQSTAGGGGGKGGGETIVEVPPDQMKGRMCQFMR